MTNYAYENGTLKNIDGLTDPDKLSAIEAERVAGRLIELRLGGGPEPTFDTRHLKALHHHLFQDVYEWAGRTRDERVQLSDGTVATMPTMQKIDGEQFAIGPAISSALDRFSEDLRGQNFLRGLDRETFADQAAGYFNRLNSIHPFREGNGRTQREFMIALTKNAGQELNFDVVSAERMAQASIAGHERGDVDAFKRMFREISDPERVQALEKAQNFLTSQGCCHVNLSNLNSALPFQRSGDTSSLTPCVEGFKAVVADSLGCTATGWNGKTIAGGRMHGYKPLQ